MIQIIHARTEAHYQCARHLFIQYAETLGLDLEFQGFSRELATLPGGYVPPRGCILLAELGGNYVGCVALRPLEIFKWIIIPLLLILVMIYRPTGLIAFKEFDVKKLIKPKHKQEKEV